jgi:Ca2+-binding RTX toxin-like protein
MATGLAGIDAAAITGASSLNATNTTAMSIADAATLTSLSNWVGHDHDTDSSTAGRYYLSDGFAAVQGADATLVNTATTVVADGTANVDTMNMSMHSAGMTITGDGGDDVITGTSGADTIDGEADNDTIAGGDGNDQFNISAGADIITDLTTGDIVDVADGASVSATGVTAFVATVDTSNLGSAAADFAIVAADAGSTVDMDLATVGTAGTDGFTLTGGAGVDNFTGSDGNDTITGGAGADSLTGGTGVDTFVYNTVDTSTAAAMDTITDYATASDILSFDTSGDGNTTGDAAIAGDVTDEIASGMATGALKVAIAADSSLADATTEFLAAASFLDNDVAGFVYDGDTYVVHADADNAAGNIVKLDGVVLVSLAENTALDTFTGAVA